MKTRKFLIVFLCSDGSYNNVWFETQSLLSQSLIELAAKNAGIIGKCSPVLIKELEV